MRKISGAEGAPSLCSALRPCSQHPAISMGSRATFFQKEQEDSRPCSQVPSFVSEPGIGSWGCLVPSPSCWGWEAALDPVLSLCLDAPKLHWGQLSCHGQKSRPAWPWKQSMHLGPIGSGLTLLPEASHALSRAGGTPWPWRVPTLQGYGGRVEEEAWVRIPAAQIFAEADPAWPCSSASVHLADSRGLAELRSSHIHEAPTSMCSVRWRCCSWACRLIGIAGLPLSGSWDPPPVPGTRCAGGSSCHTACRGPLAGGRAHGGNTQGWQPDAEAAGPLLITSHYTSQRPGSLTSLSRLLLARR